ncbi:MAG: TolC family protein [Opitutaceae bacterium]|nr:TolC family protein [Cytophagales bacterium]
MKKISKRKNILLLLLVTTQAFSQTADSTLFLKDVLKQVYQYHPLAAQAKNLSAQGKAELLFARGNYDVSFEFEATQKVFKGTDYYSYIDQGLKVPTWFGPELKAGFERNNGQYINPSDYTPPEGLAYIGFYLPIGRNLIYDERRAAVQQGKLGQNMAENEKIKLINKLAATVAKDYWDWYYQYKKYQVSKNAYKISEFNYVASVERFKAGDLASIDTTEASTGVQQRYIELNSAQNDLQNARLTLSTHMWGSDFMPLEIQDYMKPQNYTSSAQISHKELEEKLGYTKLYHPEILKMQGKVRQLELEKKLRTVSLIPNIITSYRYLTNDPLNTPKTSSDYLQNNYKIGLYIYQPLLWRKDRAKYQLAKLKLQNIQSEQHQLNRDLEIGVRSAVNDVNNLDSLIIIQEKVSQSYQRLAIAERAKFENGESTIFMVNSRETKSLETLIKLEELRAKHEKSRAYLQYATGEKAIE